MKNKVDVPLGPSPVRGSGGAALSGARGAVLERLQRSPGWITVAGLAAELEVHQNTVREHLDALVERGLAIRERAAARGRGRPAWRYAAAIDRAEPDARVRDYAGLAGALAGHLARTAADPGAAGLEVGYEWSRTLVATAGEVRPRGPHTGPRHRVVDLLDDLGFAPDADDAATTVALRRCPLLDAARQHPEVVCQVHLGIVRGVLDHHGGDSGPTALLPFAEPGACRLHLDTAAVSAGGRHE
ncbi:metalloregulator ArsR/SmtB family transcription factor [Blastococcus sp. TF02A-26]|uniref:helix-turn-helix transcriptional regulator n=1 Tax=Blastococcus sp. TF02A-26 TaxID=2250577 RepID=UPI000DE8FFD8|nr:helix-turn-helix domain-containing protein [Blastococcus sp. TF02A-26]RBY79665.1 transcriptional regulator [Blastococcus sp. TF02A-26]